MFLEFLRRSYLIWVVFILLVLSILGQIIIGVLYQKIIQGTENMAVTDDKILKQCKLKFSNCYKLNGGNINIPVFVDKFINQLKFAGLSAVNITHVSGQLMLLSIFTAGLGACKGIIEGETLGELLPYYIVSMFGLYLYFSVSSLVDVKGKKYMVRTNLIDYLENHLVKHLQLAEEEEMQPFLKSYYNLQETVQPEKTAESFGPDETKEEKECGQSSLKGAKGNEQAVNDMKEEEELETLLREFLA